MKSIEWKLTDFMSFYPSAGKFRVARMPQGTAVFVSIGPGGKGSSYEQLTADEAQDLARYLMVEVHRSVVCQEGSTPRKRKASPQRGRR